VRLFVVLAGEDHPKACTGRRLLRRGLVRALRDPGALPTPPIVLDPYASEPLASRDRRLAERGGIVAIDCSWNRLAARGRFPGTVGVRDGRLVRRRLPIVIATNPQHFGRPAQLNTVEALAAALAVLGRPSEAARLLGGFSGGDAFLSVNASRLASYAAAQDGEGVRAEELRQFGGPDADRPVTPEPGTASPR
jgi:pre-rRNA-processing protein TSR3